jgi:hypothetical protein
VNEYAFASIAQARPCPTFGRPVHLRGVSPSITARYFSACPSDFTSRWTSCPPELLRVVAVGPPWLCPAFAFVPVWASPYLPSLSGQRGIIAAFGYDAPHPSVRGTLTLLNNALLSAHYGPFRRPLLFGRLPGLAGYTDYLLRRFHDGRRRASPVAQRVLATVPPLPPRRSRVSVSASLRPSMLSSPWGEGFGLRDLHFSGLPVRSLTLRPGDSQSSF